MQQSFNSHVIGFAGRMLSGKGVLSKAMQEKYGAEIVTVASALKQLICDMRPNVFENIENLNELKRKGYHLCENISDGDVRFISEQTNVPYEFVLKKCEEHHSWGDVRDIMQFIGTEIIRQYNPNWHIEKLKENILKCTAPYVCVDDIRFPNERETVESLGGECFFIIRPQCETFSNHSSETSIRWQDFDPSHIIINETSEELFKNSFTKLFEGPFRVTSECPILLSANDYYTKHNVNFAYKLSDITIVDELLKQNVDSDLFKKYGVITYYTSDFDKRVKFTHEVLGSCKGVDFCRNKFVFYNPLIYENLKMFLDTP